MDEDTSPQELVKRSYDGMAKTYLTWTSSQPSPRVTYLQKLLLVCPPQPGSLVLELGCGAGVPGTQLLSHHYARVVANDISDAQISLAKENLPQDKNVEFLAGDMSKLDFQPASLDAVIAFYSIIHLPKPDQIHMFRQICTWLKPGGYLLCNLGTVDDPGSARTWLGGSQMYWSGFDREVYLTILSECGFGHVESQVLEDDEDGKLVPFLWILASTGS